MRSLLKRVEFVLTGEARGGDCPECGALGTVTVTEEGASCSACGERTELPEAPPW